MNDRPNLREDLLKQNGAHAADYAQVRDRILAEDQRRVRRMKWAAGLSWTMFLLVLFLAASAEYFHNRDIPLLRLTADRLAYYFPEVAWFTEWGAIIVAQSLLMLAVLLTFSFHGRSRTLTVHQIQSSLAGIEEQLRKMADKKPE